MIGLTIRATVIGGDKLDNDYCISMDGHGLGRIRQTHGLNGSTI